jgi:hypothetical protein
VTLRPVTLRLVTLRLVTLRLVPMIPINAPSFVVVQQIKPAGHQVVTSG